MKFKCYICPEKFDVLSLIVSHLKIIHMVKENVHEIKCVVNTSCNKKYASFKSLRTHVNACVKNIETNIREIDCLNCEQEEISHEINSHENIDNEINPEFVVPSVESFENAPSVSSFGFETEERNIDEFFDAFITEIITLRLNYKNTDAVFNLCEKLLKFCVEVETTNAESVQYMSTKLHSMNTKKKREKYFNNNEQFNRPESKAIGLHSEMKKDRATGLFLPKQIQSKFQYVPICKTLISLFDQAKFKQLYMDFNSAMAPETSQKHVCEPGRYRDFCCGKTFKENSLFKSHPNSIQIQLYIDGFEICDPLKPRANVHSQVGVYFAIRNLPQELAFDQQNIHLVAMCYANDLKTKYTDYNNIWNEVVRDISYLEKSGIVVDSKTTLKGITENILSAFQTLNKWNYLVSTGTLINTTFDNKEGNGSFGFVESFRANYSCRICLMSRDECQQATKEDLSKYRNRENYAEALRIIKNSTHVDYTETRGIKYECSLNKLGYFHILDNYNVDLMHDIYEGIVRFFLQRLIELCVDSKVFTFDLISAYVENFYYGKLNQHNIPSTLLDKKNVGQNSSQIRCLMLHLPYIFLDFKNHPFVQKIWSGVTSLLTIIRIVHSADLFECDLKKLENAISEHLTFVKTVFQTTLLPKHHNLLHYASVTRLVGPVVHMSTMRYEAKHKAFTDQIKLTNNFMNIGQYISLRNQQLSALTKKYGNIVRIGKLNSIDLLKSHSYDHIASQYFKNLTDVKITGWAKVNSNFYSKELFLVHESSLYEIQEIFYFKSSIFFLCTQFKTIKFDPFLNSIMINEIFPRIRKIINQNDLISPKSYERKIDGEDIFIINDSLEIDRLIINSFE